MSVGHLALLPALCCSRRASDRSLNSDQTPTISVLKKMIQKIFTAAL